MAEMIVIKEDEDGQRLDRWLRKKFPVLSFAQTQKLLRTGQVRVDGKRAKGDARLVTGQTIRIPPQVTAPPKKKEGISGADTDFIRSLVIYEDDDILAINKPSGLATQGGSKIKKHIDGLLAGLAIDGKKPHLVHRLDKDTSGVLLLARNAKMAKKMGHLFKSRDIRKYYWGITVPSPEIHHGEIIAPLAKVDGRGGERMMAVDEEEGKSAFTIYSVLENLGGRAAFVAFWPKTGRTHQIRVHAALIGCPLLGDYKYGPDQEFLEENEGIPNVLHLHARRVIFGHPATGRRVDITAPLDEGMSKTFEILGLEKDDKADPFEGRE